MEVVPQFDLYKPANLDEAAGFAKAHENARFLAGGTDLIVNLRRGIGEAETLIDLTNVAEMQALEVNDDGIVIGAGVTLAALASQDDIKAHYPAIAQAAGAVAGPTHRQFATVGGNLCLDTRCIYYNQSHWWRDANDYCLKYKGEICHVAPKSKRCFAAFSGDLAPALLVHGAEVDVLGPRGKRTMPLEELYNDDGADHLTLAPGEFVVTARLPLRRFDASGYEKIRVRDAIDFPLAGVAVGLDRADDGLGALEIAFTGTNCIPIKVQGTNQAAGWPMDDDSFEQILRLCNKQISPMKSTTTPSTYRRAVAAKMAVETVRKLWQSVA
jgi:4-hydroxybenzoyl-CoA reductase subunit beta